MLHRLRLKNLSWGYVLGEILIVVVGITIAFYVDAWWERRQEQARETEYLFGLQQDFEANRRLHGTAIAGQRNSKAAAEALLAMIHADAEAPSTDSLKVLIIDPFFMYGFGPVTRTYDDLINSGGIKVVRDDSLRMALATFAGQLATNERVEKTAQDQWNQINHPFFNSRLDFVEILRLGKPSAADLPPSRFQLDLQQFLVDRTFSNIVAGRWAVADDVQRVHISLAGHTNEILRLISKRLDEAGE